MGLRRYLGRIPSVVGGVFRNPELRRVELAFAGFNAAEWAVWIAMLVFAYHHGGATTAGLVAVVQLAPAAVCAPFASVLADRYRPARVLVWGYAAQAISLGATAAAMESGVSPLLAYGLAACASTAVTITRPTQAALLPALARSPEELTATNVVSGLIESASVLVAPALSGILLAVSTPGTVFAAMAVAVAVSALLVASLRGPAPIGSEMDVLGDAVAGFRTLGDDRSTAVVVGVLASQYVALGALDILYVVLAIAVLHVGGSGAGYLNAAFGAGGVLGTAATAALVGRRHLASALLAAALVWWLAFVILGISPTLVLAWAMLMAAGLGRTVLDVAGRTLLQRVGRQASLARIFGVLEGLSMAALAIGSLITPAFVAAFGSQAAIVCVGCILPLAALLGARRLLDADRRATVPIVELGLLRTSPLFAPLGGPELEQIARALTPEDYGPGEVVVREGEIGESFYLIGDGKLHVSVGREMGRGEGFGEIALLRNVPRTATVTAITPARVYSLAKGPFLEAVTGHPAAHAEAERLASERLARSLSTQPRRVR